MKISKRAGTAAVAATALFGLTACGGYSTEADQVGVHVNGYVMIRTDKTIAGCIQSGKSGYAGLGDTVYKYPAGQRTYKFAGKDEAEAKAMGADHPAILVVKDNIQLSLTGTVTFNLNTDCDVLKQFHTQLGVKQWGNPSHAAWISDGGDADYSGWNSMLDVYIEQPLQRAATDALLASKAGYLDLYNGQGRAEFEQAIQKDLPGAVQGLAGGPFFKNFLVQMQKPGLPPSVADARTAVETQKALNEAQVMANQTVQTELESIKALVAVLGQQGYIDYQRNKLSGTQLDLLKQAIEQGKIQILPVPQGSGLALPTK